MVNKLQKRNPSQDRGLTDGSDTDTMQPKRERGRLGGIFRRKEKPTTAQSSNASSDVLQQSSTTGTNPSSDLLAPNTNTTSNENTYSSSTVPTVMSPMSGPVHDSAYASSDAPSNSRSDMSNNIVPVHNDGQIEGVAKDRNLAVNETTGDVLDEDTGEIVSTVTTTTTTTTTTTLVRGRDGKKELRTNVNTVPVGSTTTTAATSAAPVPTPAAISGRPRDGSTVSEMPADPAPVRSSMDAPAPLSTTATRGHTPPAPTPLQTSNTSLIPDAPNVPAKSPKRSSREYERPPIETVEPVPSSPVVGSNFGANFSYPNRSANPSPPNNAPATLPPALEDARPVPPFSQEPTRHSPSSGFKAWSQEQGPQSGFGQGIAQSQPQHAAPVRPSQELRRNSSSGNLRQWSQSQHPALGISQAQAQHSQPAPFPPPPRPTGPQSYPHGPDDYRDYTAAPPPGPGNGYIFSPSAASFSHPGSQHEGYHYGYSPGPPSSYGGLSTIESMSETSSVAPSASASQAPSATPSAPTSTFGSLKAAAKGIHGVGETLRGTLNNEIDTRFPRKNAEKAAIANAKNQAALHRGQTEMAGLRPYENVTRHDGSTIGGGSTTSSSGGRHWGLRREHSIPRKPVG
ncbi:hypothetical protein Slin14017_G084600 [Septoria linicola]|nr:hypothetical protein Slin14017_G084600 [Septoria linicola]